MKKERDLRIVITYAEVTPESAEYGDYSDTGFEDEDGVKMDDISEAIQYLMGVGIQYASSSEYHKGIYYSTGFETVSYETATEKELSYHLKCFNDKEERAIFNILKKERIIS